MCPRPRLTAPVIGVCPTAQLRCAFALGGDGCTRQQRMTHGTVALRPLARCVYGLLHRTSMGIWPTVQPRRALMRVANDSLHLTLVHLFFVHGRRHSSVTPFSRCLQLAAPDMGVWPTAQLRTPLRSTISIVHCTRHRCIATARLQFAICARCPRLFYTRRKCLVYG